MRRRQFFDNKDDNFFAGIEYINETEKETNLNDGLEFVILNEQFNLLKTNKYFSVNKNELVVLKCKPNLIVNLKWEIIVLAKEKISLAFRILKNKEIINSTRVNGFANIEEVQNFGNTLVEINSKDRFIIQIKNIDLEKPTEKIIVKTVRVILES
jgi:hypothetical protein